MGEENKKDIPFLICLVIAFIVGCVLEIVLF